MLVVRRSLGVRGDELFALHRADPHPTGGELVIDARDLRFIDHRSLILLDRFAHQRAGTAVLRTSLPLVDRLIELLEISGGRTEPPA